MNDNGWKRHGVSYALPVCRRGWAGVWDALISAITQKPRFEVSRPMEISVWSTSNVKFMVSGIQIKDKNGLTLQDMYRGDK